jgi:queuine/archaeosine tRNA-ribosyltransferase
MYAVVHGGVDRELRQESIDYLTSLPFDGFAMGGYVYLHIYVDVCIRIYIYIHTHIYI